MLDKKKLEENIIKNLKTVYDPEIPVDIYELGLIYEIRIYDDANVYVKMTLTSPACPVAGSLPGEVKEKVKAVNGVNEVIIDLVFEPPWDQEKMSDEARFELGFI